MNKSVIIAVAVILLQALCVSNAAFAGTAELKVYAKAEGSRIQLKWMPAAYSGQNTYKIYRNGQEIAETKAVSYETLKKNNFSEDYIHIVHPFRNAKTLDDSIAAQNAENTARVYRMLRFMQDNKFARNLGLYYEDTGVKKGERYTYKVVLHAHKKQIAENEISLVNNEDAAVNQVFSLQAKSSTTGVTLNWSTGNTYAFYNVYRKIQGQEKFSRINQNPVYLSPPVKRAAVSAFEDTLLKKGQNAAYYVTRIDMFGDEGKPSKTVEAGRLINQMPPVVQNLFAKPRGDKVVLRWKKGEKTESYNVYRSLAYKGGYTKLNQDPVTEPAYFDKKFQAGKNYYYYVTGVNTHGESFASTKVLAFVRDVVPPPFPEHLTAETGPGVVRLSWKAVNADDLLGYRVYMSMDKHAQAWSRVTKEAVQTAAYQHDRPKTLSRHTYYYRVVAVDKAFNESAASNTLAVRLPDVTPPKAPEITSYAAYAKEVRLTWNDVLVYDFSHYNIYRKTEEDFQKINETPYVETVFKDTAPGRGMNEYAVTAVDVSGNESLMGASVKLRLNDTQPVNISGLSAERNRSGISISFKCNDMDYNGFEVYRSSGNTSKYHNISGFKKEKAFLDTETDRNTTYFYRIKAYDASGNIRESDVVVVAKRLDK